MPPLSSDEPDPGTLPGPATSPDPATGERAEPLPVLVLTGFLGAGKSTLLNHLLSGASGLRVAVVVNDFGDIEVDASQITDRVDSMMSLASGCLCCEIDADELSAALVDLAAPELGLDLVVIEASGLAEPVVLRRMVHEAPRHLVDHAGIVQVLDAENLTETLERHPRLASHIAEADLVVVNKCDLIRADYFVGLRDLVRDAAPRVAVYPAVRGAVPPELLLGAGTEGYDAPGADDRAPHRRFRGGRWHSGFTAHSHLHDDYTAVNIIPGGPLHPRRFLDLIATPPAGLFRAKGMVSLQSASGPRRYEVALVGRRLELRPEHASRVSVDDGLVLIGVDLPPDAATFLDPALLGEAEVVDPDALLGLHPFLVADTEASDVEEWIYDEQRAAPLTGEAAMLVDPEDPDAFDPAFTP